MPWKNVLYSPWSREENEDALVVLKILAKEEQHPALLMKTCWTSYKHCSVSLPGKGAAPPVGLTVLGTWTVFFQGQPGTWRLNTTMTIVRSSLALRSQHRQDWSSCSVNTAQLLFILWLLFDNCSNCYPFLSLGRSCVMITSSKSSK